MSRKETEEIERSLTALQKSAEAEVVDGVTTIRGGQGNLTTGRRAERTRS